MLSSAFQTGIVVALLSVTSKRFELLRPECAVSQEPPFHFPKRLSSERTPVDATVDRARYEARLFEYAQVFRDCNSGHVKRFGQLAYDGRTRCQSLEK